MPKALIYILHYVLFIGAVAWFTIQARARLKYVKLGKPENRTDQPGKRWGAVFKYVIGQRRLFRDFIPGVAHAFIFWGFCILAIGYGIFFLTAHEIHEGFLADILPQALINLYLGLQDVFAFLVLLGILYGFFNHFIRRYERLSNNFDAAFVLSLILLIIVSFFLTSALSTVITGDVNPWQPFGNILAGMLAGIPLGTAKMIYAVSYWLHAIIILGFLIYLPGSKHMHLVFSEPNVYLMNLKHRGMMSMIDLEDEEAESFGANKAEDFTWKSLFDSYACVECGRCTAVCPANNTDKPLNPKYIINKLREYLDDRRSKPEGEKPEAIIGDYTTEDEIWSCTTCYACMQECPILIEHLDKIYEYRRNLVLMETKMPSELNQFFKNLETRSNPWPIGRDARGDWAEGLPVKKFSSENKKADYLFFVGCAASYDDRNKKVAEAFVKIMDKAGVDIKILGAKEGCCGEPARRLGNEYQYQMMAMENIETFSQYEFKKIVTMCPHCFNTIKNEYPQLEGEYEVIHHTQLLSDLIKEGKIKPEKEVKEVVAFHDSCYLGRYNDIYDEPRSALSSVPGVEMKEMEKCKSFSFCCGGGGGRMWLEENIGTRINQARIEQADELNPDSMVSACPYCLTMFSDGIEETGKEESLKALDIAEVIEKSL